jgi:LPXTG-motif cell wall-anchored protein
VACPTQAGRTTDGTYVSQQTGGPDLGLCATPKTTRTTHSSSGDRTSTGATGGLANTGSSRWVAVAGLGALVGAALMARRRRSS